jgi:hypothetical protein
MAHFTQILDRDSHHDIRYHAYESKESALPDDVFRCIFAELNYLCAGDDFEFMRERLRK